MTTISIDNPLQFLPYLFSADIRDVFQGIGLPLDDIEARAGVAPGSIARFVSNRNLNPTMDEYLSACFATGLDPREYFGLVL